MAKTSQIMSTFAEKGAALRLFEIEEEKKAILRSFPNLKGKTFEVYLPAHVTGRKVGDAIKREKPKAPENTNIKAKRRTMTAAARKEVSARMKAYWTKRRIESAKGAKKR